MWSQPVEGRGSDHLEKNGMSKGQAKAGSSMPNLPTVDMEKHG